MPSKKKKIPKNYINAPWPFSIVHINDEYVCDLNLVIYTHHPPTVAVEARVQKVSNQKWLGYAL